MPTRRSTKSLATDTAHRVVMQVGQDQAHVPTGGGTRFVTVQLGVPARPRVALAPRAPVSIGLVIDRSGSMGGGKLEVAKQAALEVVDRLSDTDEIAVTIFDTEIDVIQPRARVSPEVRIAIRNALRQVQARGGTALHLGWLTGARAIAQDHGAPSGAPVARCFLLTDGQANEGVTDRTQICTDVAATREVAGVVTSTFGIGNDYDENLLVPMAEAGGGRFHNLRTPEEIVQTFVGEIDEVFAIATTAVNLEVAIGSGSRAQVVAGYYATAGQSSDQDLHVAVGDLLFGSTRHVTLQIVLPAGDGTAKPARIRTSWRVPGIDAVERTPWQEVVYTYASDEICAADPLNNEVIRYAADHVYERARRRAVNASTVGDFAEVQRSVDDTSPLLSAWATRSPAVADQMRSFAQEAAVLSEAPMDAASAKEAVLMSALRVTQRADLRGARRKTKEDDQV